MSQNLDTQPLSGQVIRAAVELVGFISLTAAVLGVFGVFLGWRVSSAYFYSFGLTSEWLPFQPIQLVILAWVEMILVLCLISYCVIVQLVVQHLDRSANERTLRTILLAAIVVCLSTGIAMLVIFMQNTVMVGVGVFFVIGGLAFCSLWLVVVLGSHLFAERTDSETRLPPKLNSVVTTLFSAKAALILITVGLAIIYLSGFATKHGTFTGIRDKGPNTRLPQISILTNSMLQVPNGQRIAGAVQGEDAYLYSDLRLVTQSSDFLFAFRLSETDPATGSIVCHIVPLESVLSLQITKWPLPQPTVLSPSTTQTVPSP